MFKKPTILFVLLTALMLSLAACSRSKNQVQNTPVELDAPVIQIEETETVTEEETTVPVAAEDANSSVITYPIIDTNQGLCFNNSELIDCPAEGEAFFGQDAQFTGNEPSYTDNGDGTITDNVTGLVWTQEISSYAMPWSDAVGYCESLDTGDVTDWRLPNLKELWSIRDFSQGWPWVDTDYFHLVGDGSQLAQHHSWTSNLYLVESEYQNQQVQDDPAWIVNDWTGHIKAMSGSRFVRCVSGEEYGVNDFVDNGDGTVTDNATGLMWAQDDNGEAVDWETALAYADGATIAGYDDWRLPNAKELQSIADYSGIFPVLDTDFFNLSELTNVVYDTETGDEIATQITYPAYWTSTSNPILDEDATEGGNTYAWLLAAGYNPDTSGYDLHGAGSVVFDTKAEEVSDGTEFEIIYHHARLVRDGDVTETPYGDPTTVDPDRVDVFEDGDTGMGGNGEGGQPGGAEGQEGAPGEQQGMPDFAAAAAQLGVTEEALMDALGDPNQGQPDIAAAAEALGVTEAELMDALGIADGGSGRPQGGQPPGNTP